ncbi:hypothetical protein HD_0022 [[Haemophilus] ducreyi 35000HP]|uniref:Uncharacterized protein n=1 Tax=Haemophilus ducreyi (strain 35000HP / ATCC 700724) TaxID=233412 RepID=Q7VPN4_HAEDU|nr:hypothetical protein HD_0022 [[Haemophilus] ducreyi 35000HP]
MKVHKSIKVVKIKQDITAFEHNIRYNSTNFPINEALCKITYTLALCPALA